MYSSGEDDEICLNIHLGIRQSGNVGPGFDDDKRFGELLNEWRPPPIPLEEIRKRCAYIKPLKKTKDNSEEISEPSTFMKKRKKRKHRQRVSLAENDRNAEFFETNNQNNRPSLSYQEQIRESSIFRTPKYRRRRRKNTKTTFLDEANKNSEAVPIRNQYDCLYSSSEEQEQIRENCLCSTPLVETNDVESIQIQNDNICPHSSNGKPEEIIEKLIYLEPSEEIEQNSEINNKINKDRRRRERKHTYRYSSEEINEKSEAIQIKNKNNGPSPSTEKRYYEIGENLYVTYDNMTDNFEIHRIENGNNGSPLSPEQRELIEILWICLKLKEDLREVSNLLHISKRNRAPSTSTKKRRKARKRKYTKRTSSGEINRHFESIPVENNNSRSDSSASFSTDAHEEIEENFINRSLFVNMNENFRSILTENENSEPLSSASSVENIRENYIYRPPFVIVKEDFNSKLIQIENENIGAFSSALEKGEIRKRDICNCIIL